MSGENHEDINTQLLQGAESRFLKADRALARADELLPVTAFDGTASELRQLIKDLQDATTNITELLAYRKMAGID